MPEYELIFETRKFETSVIIKAKNFDAAVLVAKALVKSEDRVREPGDRGRNRITSLREWSLK